MAINQQALSAAIAQVQNGFAQEMDGYRRNMDARIQAAEHVTTTQAVTIAELQKELRAAHVAHDEVVAHLRAGGGGGGGGGGGDVAMDADGDPRGGPREAHRLLRLTFEGKSNDDWLSFKQAFLNQAKFNNYTDMSAKRALLACMKSNAFLAVQHINLEDNDLTLDRLLEQYEAKFMPRAASNMAKTRFENAQQQKNEDIMTYHGRLLLLWQRAYPTVQHHADEILIRAFSQGLNNVAIKKHVYRENPATYDAALHAALNEQAVIDSVNPVVGGASGMPRVGPTRYGGSNNQSAGEPMEIGAMGGNPTANPRCHFCNLFGHFKKDCPKRVATAKSAGGAQGGAQGGANATTKFRKREPAGNRGPGKNKRLAALFQDLADSISEMHLGEEDAEQEAQEDDPGEYPDDEEPDEADSDEQDF